MFHPSISESSLCPLLPTRRDEPKAASSSYFRTVQESHAASQLVHQLAVSSEDELRPVSLRKRISALAFKNLRVLYRHR